MSELRVIHLLEGLCEGLGKQYDLVDDALASAQGAQRWARSGEVAGRGPPACACNRRRRAPSERSRRPQPHDGAAP